MAIMFQAGFWGTQAPVYMDIFLLMMVLLPLLMGIIIWQAIQQRYALHGFLQTITFLSVFVLLAYVEYTLYFEGGLSLYTQGESADAGMVFSFWLFHVFVAMVTMLLWFSTIWYARADRKRRALPGLYSKGHRRMGKIVAWSIFGLSLSVVLLYWMLFVA